MAGAVSGWPSACRRHHGPIGIVPRPGALNDGVIIVGFLSLALSYLAVVLSRR